MSLNRLAVRLATVLALTNNGVAPWPTLAEDRVHDSKNDPIEDLAVSVALPIAAVYTDQDVDAPASQTTNTRERRLTLTIELAMIARADTDDAYEIGVPTTDDELETSLDLFETQVHAALRSSSPAAEIWKSLVHGETSIISKRAADAETGSRLAARQIVMELGVLRDAIRGTIPTHIEVLAGLLDVHPTLSNRAATLRAFATAAAGQSALDQDLAAMGWTRDVAERLGRPVHPSASIASRLVYVGSGAHWGTS